MSSPTPPGPGPTFKKIEAAEQRRHEERSADQRALMAELETVPKIDQTVIPAAVDALLDAVDSYRRSFPLLDDNGRRSRPLIADARKSVARLDKTLASVQSQMAELPLDASNEVVRAYEVWMRRWRTELKGTTTDRRVEPLWNASMGELRTHVAHIREFVQAALNELNKYDNKPTDHDRKVLAYDVAWVFKNILKIDPPSTSDKSSNVSGYAHRKRGGAAYARVLRATLKVAGVTQFDPGLLIEAGLDLLKDDAEAFPSEANVPAIHPNLLGE